LGMGSWSFAGQYQQNAAPLEGGLIKRNWLRFYKVLPEKFDFMVQSWDCTFKGSEDTDFVAGQVWGKAQGKFFMLPYRLHERLDFGPTKAAIKSAHALYPRAHAILIEDKANGPAIISELRQEISGIVPINPEGGKLARAQAVSPLFEAGSVELPDPKCFDVPWLESYIHGICTFPKAAHDDDMDATSQALTYIRNRSGSGMFEFMRREGQKQQQEENVSKGKPPVPGARIKETVLTRSTRRAIELGSQISCHPSQYPEIRQALMDLGTPQALAEVERLDQLMSWQPDIPPDQARRTYVQ
jgi:predicted phage terminase large subunit-like protein